MAKSSEKTPKKVHFGEFFFKKPEAFGQTVLQDMSILIGQKLVENAKIEKYQYDTLRDFQTLCCVDCLTVNLTNPEPFNFINKCI